MGKTWFQLTLKRRFTVDPVQRHRRDSCAKSKTSQDTNWEFVRSNSNQWRKSSNGFSKNNFAHICPLFFSSHLQSEFVYFWLRTKQRRSNEWNIAKLRIEKSKLKHLHMYLNSAYFNQISLDLTWFTWEQRAPTISQGVRFFVNVFGGGTIHAVWFL